MYQDKIYSLALIDKFLSENSLIDHSKQDELGCLDSISVSIQRIEPVISGIKLTVTGCVLLKASVNAICLEIENKTKQEALKIIDDYLKMFIDKTSSLAFLPENLKVFSLFRSFTKRRDCLLLGASQIKSFLNS